MRSLPLWILDMFVLYLWKWSTKVIFQKNNFENLKNLQSFVNIFAFFIKISCQGIESPLSKQSTTLSLTPPCLEKKIISTLLAKLEKVKHHSIKGGGGGGGIRTMTCFEVFWSLKGFKISKSGTSSQKDKFQQPRKLNIAKHSNYFILQ